ncbi:amidohydrolase [Halomonas sp. V046]|uniref:amidohydrolase n=1 Tax=Halomonas sp. V046 TaxID=3459611 RepID=UPI004044D5FB
MARTILPRRSVESLQLPRSNMLKRHARPPQADSKRVHLYSPAILAGLLIAPGLAVGDSLLVTGANGYAFSEHRQLTSFQSLYIEDGKVVERGGADLAQRHADAERTLDVGGKTLLPGLIDAHTHLMGLGYGLLEVDLRDLASAQASAETVAAFAADNPSLPWIRGRGWNQVLWDGQAFPTSAELDAVIADRPVVLSRVDGHAIWVNSRAMEIAGIDADTEAPDGGEILRDADGNPTGVFIDNAESLISEQIPARSPEEMEKAYDAAVAHTQALGLTQVHIAGSSRAELEYFGRRAEQGTLGLRLYPMISSSDPDFDALLAEGIVDDPSDWLDIRSVKIYADGALGSRGAALLAPYDDRPDSSGLMIQSQEELTDLVRRTRDQGFQANMHAIGDRANRIALDIYAASLEEAPDSRDMRHRIEHAQVVSVDDIPRFAKLGVIPSMQPTHATSDKNMAGDRIGDERLAGAYAWRYFLDSGSRIASGSDFPVEPANPFFGLHAAVTRQDRDDEPAGGWLPGQKLTMAEALRSFTVDAAYAAHQEESLGALLPGQWADFIVVDHDVVRDDPAALPDTQVLSTWIAGNPVYRRDP